MSMSLIIGLDEVGRGCWAGPVVAAAVALNYAIPGLADSKKLSPVRRATLDADIRLHAEAIGIGWVDAPTIDKVGLSAAVSMAMHLAYDQLAEQLNTADIDIIVDGNINYLDDLERSKAVIRADGTVPAVSAASIVAKVARDSYMHELSKKYPAYGFENHVGYGTTYHLEALTTYGITDIHRLSFKPVQQFVQRGVA